jgi:hypothetical protein
MPMLVLQVRISSTTAEMRLLTWKPGKLVSLRVIIAEDSGNVNLQLIVREDLSKATARKGTHLLHRLW